MLLLECNYWSGVITTKSCAIKTNSKLVVLFRVLFNVFVILLKGDCECVISPV